VGFFGVCAEVFWAAGDVTVADIDRPRTTPNAANHMQTVQMSQVAVNGFVVRMDLNTGCSLDTVATEEQGRCQVQI